MNGAAVAMGESGGVVGRRAGWLVCVAAAVLRWVARLARCRRGAKRGAGAREAGGWALFLMAGQTPCGLRGGGGCEAGVVGRRVFIRGPALGSRRS